MATGNDRYAHLNQLSTDQLKALLRTDMWTADNSESDIDAMLYILQILEQREVETSPQSEIDLDQAWSEFQTRYHVPEGDGQVLYPETDTEETAQVPQQSPKIITFHWVFRKIAVVAAVVVICIFSMVVAQAAGLDIFGALAKWTDETFQFVSSQNDVQQKFSPKDTSQNEKYHKSIAEKLEECNIPNELAPRIIPDGFVMSDPFVSSHDTNTSVYCEFSDSNSEEYFSLCYRIFSDSSVLQGQLIQKDTRDVTQYMANDMVYYCFSNLEDQVATWSDGNSLLIQITGTISNNCMKDILKGIG